jgi:tetratricopeptide (TPR) repeat protein
VVEEPGVRARTDDWALAAASAGDWPTLVAKGRFALALQTLRLVGGDAVETHLPPLADLQGVERHVQRKEFAPALARLEGMAEVPPDLFDRDAAAADLRALIAASDAIDRRDFEVAGERLLSLTADHFEAERATLLGTMAVLNADPEGAAGHFDAALARDPQHLRALTNRGNLKLEAGDVDGAIADYQAAIRADDSFANAHHNLGVAYRRLGKISQSVAALRRAQRSNLRQETETVRGARGLRRAAAPRNRSRWLWWAAIALIAFWFARQQGLI